jgi:hypothetical protein
MVMASRLLASGVVATSGLAAVALAVGCASILSIPDRTVASTLDGSADAGAPDASRDWCDQPGNKHDFCDDFDNGDAGAGWTTGSTDGATIAFNSSTDSPPTALDLSTVPLPLGVATVAGLYEQFSQKFVHVRFAVDVRFMALDLETEGGLSAQLGFLLLEQTGFCLGVVTTPAGIGLVMRHDSTDCTSVADVPDDAGSITDDAGLTEFAIIAPVPTLSVWSHVTVDVTRNSDGSGTVGFDINLPGRLPPPQIPAGYLTEDPPAVAVATSVVGPSGRVDLEFDNVTVDFLPN